MFGGNYRLNSRIKTKETGAIMVLSKYGDGDSLKRGRYHLGI